MIMIIIISFGVGFTIGIYLMTQLENSKHKKELQDLNNKYIECMDTHFKDI